MDIILDDDMGLSEEFLSLVKQYQENVEKQKKLIEMVKKMEENLRKQLDESNNE